MHQPMQPEDQPQPRSQGTRKSSCLHLELPSSQEDGPVRWSGHDCQPLRRSWMFGQKHFAKQRLPGGLQQARLQCVQAWLQANRGQRQLDQEISKNNYSKPKPSIQKKRFYERLHLSSHCSSLLCMDARERSTFLVPQWHWSPNKWSPHTHDWVRVAVLVLIILSLVMSCIYNLHSFALMVSHRLSITYYCFL